MLLPFNPGGASPALMMLIVLACASAIALMRALEQPGCPLCGGRREHSRACPQKDRDEL